MLKVTTVYLSGLIKTGCYVGKDILWGWYFYVTWPLHAWLSSGKAQLGLEKFH